MKMDKTMRTARGAFEKFNVACTKQGHKCTLARSKNRTEQIKIK